MRNRYIFLRHGETIYQTKKDGFLYPWPDFVTDLTQKGKKQAGFATKKIKNREINLIFSSDFLRTRQTAEIAGQKLGLKVNPVRNQKFLNGVNFDKRLRDINWGIFCDGPVKNYLRIFSSKKQRFSKRAPGGENWRDVKKRMTDFIKETDKKYKNKTILIVSHGDPLWLLYGALKGLNEKQLLTVRHNKNFYPDVGQYLKL